MNRKIIEVYPSAIVFCPKLQTEQNMHLCAVCDRFYGFKINVGHGAEPQFYLDCANDKMVDSRDKLIALIVEKKRCSACPLDHEHCNSCGNYAECEEAIKAWSENRLPAWSKKETAQ